VKTIDELLRALDQHIGQLSPHVRERRTAQLLIEARDALRVSERALENLVTLLLDTSVPIGPMRSRNDYPHELREAVKLLRHPQGEADVQVHHDDVAKLTPNLEFRHFQKKPDA
jgi:hypothetical protein